MIANERSVLEMELLYVSMCNCFFFLTMLWTGDVFEEIVIQSETIRLSRCCSLSLLIGTLSSSSVATTICLLFSGGHLQGYLQIQPTFAEKRAILRRTLLHLWLRQPCRIIKHLIFSWRNILTPGMWLVSIMTTWWIKALQFSSLTCTRYP